MALVNCPECNREISDKAGKCPHCGFPLSQTDVVGKIRLNSSNIIYKFKKLPYKLIMYLAFGAVVLYALISIMTKINVDKNIIKTVIKNSIENDISSDSKLKIKFGKYTNIDNHAACYSVDTNNDKGRQYILLKLEDKWKIIRAPLISHDKCIEEAKIEYSSYINKSIEEEEVKKAVLRSMKDPDSVNFGRIKVIRNKYACVSANAKNSYGGYTGYKDILVSNIDGVWIPMEIEFKYTSCEDMAMKMP